MLDVGERAQVINELAEVLAQTANVRQFFSLAISDNAERNRFLQRLPLQMDRASDAAHLAVEICLVDGWAAQPTWLESILTRVNQTQQRPYVAQLLLRLAERTDTAPEPFWKYWIKEKYPFFDRSQLRPLCKRLLTGETLPVLTISGPNSSGYSYTARILGEFARLLPRPSRVVEGCIPPDYASMYRPEELAEELALQIPGAMGSGGVPQPTGSSYPTQLVRWLISKVHAVNEVIIFVIEGACQDGINEETAMFVEELASRICVAAVREKARLVLINHPRPLLKILPADTLKEIVQDPRSLTQMDLLPCLQELNEIRCKNLLGPLPVELDALAVEMLEQAPAAGSARLRYLHEQLHTLLSA
jgi:hypothetical protein